jgi:hypothetical protein
MKTETAYLLLITSLVFSVWLAISSLVRAADPYAHLIIQ